MIRSSASLSWRLLGLTTLLSISFSLLTGCEQQQKLDALENNFIDSVQKQVGGQYDKEHEIVKQLSPALQAIYLSYLLEVEVTNGGFEQYFWNYSENYVGDTIKGLNMMGAYKHAQILEKAENLWKQENHEDAQLSTLDNEFLNMNNDLDEVRRIYMQTHHELLLAYRDPIN